MLIGRRRLVHGGIRSGKASDLMRARCARSASPDILGLPHQR